MFYRSQSNYLNIQFLSAAMFSYFRQSSFFCLRNIITALPNRIISSVRRNICWCFQHFLIQERWFSLFNRSGVKICIMIKINKTFPPLNNPKYFFSCRDAPLQMSHLHITDFQKKAARQEKYLQKESENFQQL